MHLQHTARLARVGDSADLTQVLKEKGFRITPQRYAIVSEIMRARGHINPAAIARKVRQRMPGINASTVYRTIAMLEEAGILSHAHMESGPEYHRAGEPEHVHLVCSRCGRTDDLSLKEARSLVELIGRHSGFAPDLTHFAVAGLCAKCQ